MPRHNLNTWLNDLSIPSELFEPERVPTSRICFSEVASSCFESSGLSQFVSNNVGSDADSWRMRAGHWFMLPNTFGPDLPQFRHPGPAKPNRFAYALKGEANRNGPHECVHDLENPVRQYVRMCALDALCGMPCFLAFLNFWSRVSNHSKIGIRW